MRSFGRWWSVAEIGRNRDAGRREEGLRRRPRDVRPGRVPRPPVVCPSGPQQRARPAGVARLVPLGRSGRLDHRRHVLPRQPEAGPACALGIVDWDAATGLSHHVGLRGRAEVLPLDAAMARTIFRRYFGPHEDDWDRRFDDVFTGELGLEMVRIIPETVVIRDQSYRPTPWARQRGPGRSVNLTRGRRGPGPPPHPSTRPACDAKAKEPGMDDAESTARIPRDGRRGR